MLKFIFYNSIIIRSPMNEASVFLEVFAMGMEKELFQITEAARACGLSRSTLLRMEEKGLLTPAYLRPKGFFGGVYRQGFLFL